MQVRVTLACHVEIWRNGEWVPGQRSCFLYKDLDLNVVPSVGEMITFCMKPGFLQFLVTQVTHSQEDGTEVRAVGPERGYDFLVRDGWKDWARKDMALPDREWTYRSAPVSLDRIGELLAQHSKGLVTLVGRDGYPLEVGGPTPSSFSTPSGDTYYSTISSRVYRKMRNMARSST